MREALDRLLVGRTLAGRYRVEALIGTGGMSVVYRAHDLTLGRPVAAKVVSLDAANDEERERLRARFRREAGSAARIPAHPNVVQIHDYGTDEELGLDFIVMELLEGRDLKQAMAAGTFPRPEAVRILRETARGLAAGHRAGIVHRDVKPANVFLIGASPHELEGVRVLDFGIAKAMEPEEGDDLTRTGQAPHSPAYAAPEQIDTTRPITPASDVYSLGLIAYEMLAGERPFGDAERARIRSGAQVPLPDRGTWSDVPAPLVAVVERALRTDPGERFGDAAEVAEALASLPTPGSAEAVAVLPPAVDDDHTHLAPPVVTIRPATAGAHPPANMGLDTVHDGREPVAAPLDPPAARTRARLPRNVWMAIPLVLAALIGIWLLGRRGRAAEGGDAVLPDSVQLTSLDDEFLRLQGTVASGTPMAAGAAPSTVAAVRDTTRPAVPVEAIDAAREAPVVQQAIIDLHQSWVQGDLPRMMSHYAPEVRFHQRSTSSYARVQSEIGQLMAKYPIRTVTLKEQAITFPEPGQAKALVEREWDYRGPSDHWTGHDRLLLLFAHDNGAWKITTERRQTTYRSRHRRI
ncbi:MAG TPA: protein kinase [Longimicrobiaceae bacterium]|nr:protein kinase [Longimicrobiaceae bacterium]